MSLIFATSCLFYSYDKLNVKELLTERNNHKEMGTFYEAYYKDPQSVNISSPKNKPNLILIFAESMEATYANKEYNGDNLIPELTKLADENINFSHNDNLGGFHNLKVAGYTQASLITQLCAIPLRLPIDSARYRPKNGFLPGATCLYDVLAKDDYNLSFMYIPRTYQCVTPKCRQINAYEMKKEKIGGRKFSYHLIKTCIAKASAEFDC